MILGNRIINDIQQEQVESTVNDLQLPVEQVQNPVTENDTTTDSYGNGTNENEPPDQF
jgi:hypothetical protein